jgi:hypothetical protein
MADSVIFISSTDARADAAEIGASAVLEMKADKKPATLAAAAAMPIIDAAILKGSAITPLTC